MQVLSGAGEGPPSRPQILWLDGSWVPAEGLSVHDWCQASLQGPVGLQLKQSSCISLLSSMMTVHATRHFFKDLLALNLPVVEKDLTLLLALLSQPPLQQPSPRHTQCWARTQVSVSLGEHLTNRATSPSTQTSLETMILSTQLATHQLPVNRPRLAQAEFWCLLWHGS